MVHAAQKGTLKKPSPEVAAAAKSMKPKAATEFASTKHKDLPDHVEKAAATQPRTEKAAAMTPSQFGRVMAKQAMTASREKQAGAWDWVKSLFGGSNRASTTQPAAPAQPAPPPAPPPAPGTPGNPSLQQSAAKGMQMRREMGLTR